MKNSKSNHIPRWYMTIVSFGWVSDLLCLFLQRSLTLGNFRLPFPIWLPATFPFDQWWYTMKVNEIGETPTVCHRIVKNATCLQHAAKFRTQRVVAIYKWSIRTTFVWLEHDYHTHRQKLYTFAWIDLVPQSGPSSMWHEVHYLSLIHIWRCRRRG